MCTHTYSRFHTFFVGFHFTRSKCFVGISNLKGRNRRKKKKNTKHWKPTTIAIKKKMKKKINGKYRSDEEKINRHAAEAVSFSFLFFFFLVFFAFKANSCYVIDPPILWFSFLASALHKIEPLSINLHVNVLYMNADLWPDEQCGAFIFIIIYGLAFSSSSWLFTFLCWLLLLTEINKTVFASSFVRARKVNNGPIVCVSVRLHT